MCARFLALQVQGLSARCGASGSAKCCTPAHAHTQLREITDLHNFTRFVRRMWGAGPQDTRQAGCSAASFKSTSSTQIRLAWPTAAASPRTRPQLTLTV